MSFCPICRGRTAPMESLDFSDPRESAPRNEPIEYVKCMQCAFVYTPAMYAWSPEDYARRVYNDRYWVVDPEFREIRPKQNAAGVAHMKFTRHLDYGGGNGRLSELVTAAGRNSTTWDPFHDPRDLADMGQFDLITAFEVFEHSPDPQALMRDLRALIAPGGRVLFTTLVNDGQPSLRDWWYAQPRWGHVSLHSQKSLQILGDSYGFQVHHRDLSMHCFVDKLTLHQERSILLPDDLERTPGIVHRERNRAA